MLKMNTKLNPTIGAYVKIPLTRKSRRAAICIRYKFYQNKIQFINEVYHDCNRNYCKKYREGKNF